MNRYKVKEGKHYDVDGNEYCKGDVIETTEQLTKLFANKFEDLGPAPVKQAPVQENNGDNGEAGNGAAPVMPEGTENVTAQFPEAAGKELVVLKKGAWYSVYDPDNLEQPLNEKQLREAQVIDFINEF